MWPLPKLHNEYVSISLSPAHLTCSWITASTAPRSLMLKAFKQTNLERGQYSDSILFNPTTIGNQIDAFLRINNIKNAFISLSISGPTIVETLVDLPVSSPTAGHFPFPKLQKLVWDYRYLYPKDNAHFAFYVSGIPRQLLFQYQLLSIARRLNITMITTERMALLALYQYSKGPAFRRSQLEQDMHAHQNELSKFFSADSLARIVTIPPHISNVLKTHTVSLSHALGLFIAGTNNHETN